MSNTIKKISKNTLFLYIRMVVLMIISLYTSRLLLSILGFTDYGIYSVVGSVTTTFYSLRSVFAEAIQRFLNFEKGKNNLEGQIEVFNISVFLHLIIGIIFVVLVEIVGLWLLKSKLVITPERLSSAYCVFHFSIISMFLSILIIPYDALVVANEKMNVYAWISIFDGVAKLFIVLALPSIDIDSLKAYSFLLILVPLVNLMIYLLYCKRFDECIYTFRFRRSRVREVFFFSGWSFSGNLFFTLVHEGINILINLFGGVYYNASRNIAYQIRSAVSQLSNNTLLAVKPFILQSSAIKKEEKILEYLTLINRAGFYIMLLTCVPFIICTRTFISLWLVDVPPLSVEFTQLIIFSVLIRSMHGPINLFYMGTGHIKMMTILESLLFVLLLLLSYIILKFLRAPIWIVFAISVVFEYLIVLILTINIHYEFKIDVSVFFRKGILPCIFLSSISALIIFAIISLNFFIVWSIFMSVVMELLLIALFSSKEEKNYISKLWALLKRDRSRLFSMH